MGGRGDRGLHAGRHPPGPAGHRLLRPRRARSSAAQPDIHMHAFSPMEVINGASRTNLSIRDWLTRGQEGRGSTRCPGTAAEILDDDVRWVLTKGKLPHGEVGRGRHHRARAGHPDDLDDDVRPRRHPRALGRAPQADRAAIQERTGGFTEFVLLPFVHHNAPIYLAGLARPGPTAAGEPRGARAVPDPAARRDRQHPVLVGEARTTSCAARCSRAGSTTSAAR